MRPWKPKSKHVFCFEKGTGTMWELKCPSYWYKVVFFVQVENMMVVSQALEIRIPSDTNKKAGFFKNHLAWTIVVARSGPPHYSRGHVCHNVLQENYIWLLTFHAQRLGLTQSFLRISNTISFENIQLTSPCQGRKSWWPRIPNQLRNLAFKNYILNY